MFQKFTHHKTWSCESRSRSPNLSISYPYIYSCLIEYNIRFKLFALLTLLDSFHSMKLQTKIIVIMVYDMIHIITGLKCKVTFDKIYRKELVLNTSLKYHSHGRIKSKYLTIFRTISTSWCRLFCPPGRLRGWWRWRGWLQQDPTIPVPTSRIWRLQGCRQSAVGLFVLKMPCQDEYIAWPRNQIQILHIILKISKYHLNHYDRGKNSKERY